MDTNTKHLVNRYRIRADVEYGAPDNPEFPDSTPWTVTLKMGRKRLTTPFYTGAALTGEPEADDVLDCLIMDASAVDNAVDFEDWCNEYGMDTDSRRAERAYMSCVRQSLKLKRFLNGHYDEFMQGDRL